MLLKYSQYDDSHALMYQKYSTLIKQSVVYEFTAYLAVGDNTQL